MIAVYGTKYEENTSSVSERSRAETEVKSVKHNSDTHKSIPRDRRRKKKKENLQSQVAHVDNK